ncbi:MAG: Holliday junction branch migration protein RuvA [Mycoplasma sp.]|nr:Holliday junction branch migration protein RuvA [Mycoplasma sp.]
MKLYKIGTIKSIGKNYIILETSNIGEIIYVSDSTKFKKNIESKVFIFEYKYEHIESTYGFITFKERVLFDDLLSVPGIGPKTGIVILKTQVDFIINLIIKGDFEKLSEIPGIGLKSSQQIIFELQNKYKNMKIKNKTTKRIYQPSEITTTLKTLGFNNKQIQFVIKKLESSDNVEKMIESAIRILSSETKESINA